MSIRKPKPSAAVKIIRDAFKSIEPNVVFSTKQAYNLLAQLEGFKNWAHAKPILNSDAAKAVQPKIGVSRKEIEGWPKFVFYSGYEDEGDSWDEVLFMLPEGSTFENQQSDTRYALRFKSYGGIRVPDVFKHIVDAEKLEAKRMSSFVVTDVFSVIPRAEKYGIPDYANQRGVADWILKDLGWNYVTYDCSQENPPVAFDVEFACSGDDGGGQYWVELSVAPDVAALLSNEFSKAIISE